MRWARSEDWLTLLVASVAVLVVVRSAEAADWVVTPSLSLTAIVGALVGLLVARIGIKAWQTHLIAAGLGALTVYLQATGLTEAETLFGRMSELHSRLATWGTALVDNKISTDPLPFAIILSLLAWSAGYLSSWAIFKRGNVWLAIVPSALGLVVNLTYLPDTFYIYLFIYLLVAMMLIIRLNSLQRQSLLEKEGIEHPSSLPILWLLSGLVFSSIIVGVVFLLPASDARNEGLRKIWNASRTPVELLQQEFGRTFSAVGSKTSGVNLRFGATLPILPSVSTTTEPVFFGNVPHPAYWRVRAYTTYSSGGWTIDNTVLEDAPITPPIVAEVFEEEDPNQVYYRVNVASPASLLYLPSPATTWIDIPAEIEGHEDAREYTDTVTLRPKKRLKEGDEYVGSFFSLLRPAEQLRSIGTNYPQWVTEQYLDLPSSLPQRVRDLALDITKEATNPYDKVRAIEEHLRTLNYGVAPSLPDFNADRIDYFLFESQTGHSDHFASAMTVMVRAVGISARLVSGYGPGVLDTESPFYIVSGIDQHSWPEVYFGDYGWTEFEPSPIYPLRPREISDLANYSASLAALTTLGPIEEIFLQEELEANTEEEIDLGGGRLDGGDGLQPLPLVHRISPIGTGGVLLVAFLALWAAGMWLVWRRYFLALPRPELAYARMHRMASLMEVAPTRGQTPMEFGRALTNLVPEAEEDVTLICETYSKTQYARAKLSVFEGLRISTAWTRVRKAIMRRSLNLRPAER